MGNKDKLFLVFYVNMQNQESSVQLHANIKRNIENLTTELDDIIFFILPDTSLSINSIKLEALNPNAIEPEKFEYLLKLLETKINDSK